MITTHLTEVIKDNMAELLSYAETQKLLDDLDKDHQKLIADIVPTQITVGGIQRTLQNLLEERISIRDLPTILEGISEACAQTRNINAITEHVRTRLARQISDANANPDGVIRRVPGRHRRRDATVHGAQQVAGIHRRHPPDLRTSGHDG